jgi:hypothetical protein
MLYDTHAMTDDSLSHQSVQENAIPRRKKKSNNEALVSIEEILIID